ncbi:MAG: hypothetical protein WCD70_04715 [Alphaproteobacteria bacterium]
MTCEDSMFKKSAAALITLLALTACSTSQPRVIQASADSPNIILTVGMATQIEMPDAGHVQSITVGNPALLTAEQNTDVVNLSAKEGPGGETNLIIRSRDEAGHTKVYQYHVTVQNP